MIVKSIELKNYRNYGELKTDFSSGINIIYGDNAQGKTNLLEAVYACATTSSHRSSKEKELIAFGEEDCHVRLFMEKKGVESRIDFHISREKGKEAALNGVALAKVSDLLGHLHAVFFSPEDLKIIKSAPAERRTFLNTELFQLDPVYTRELIAYKRTLNQRNYIIREAGKREDMRAMLDVYDEKLSELGEHIMETRRAFLEEMEETVKPIHEALSGGKEELSIRYEPGAEQGKMAEKLFLSRDRDIAVGTTGCGPQRDEIVFSIGGSDAKKFGSQGQQRTAALALKLAEIELVRKKTGDTPVLLLDDVLSELDAGRQEMLLSSVGTAQTFITCTGLDEFVKRSFVDGKKMKLTGGKLAEVE